MAIDVPAGPAGPVGPADGYPGVLPELVGLLLTTPSVEDFLADLARLAVASLPAAASCGITLARERTPMTVASSDALSAAVDEVQYGGEGGPCVQTLETGVAVDVPDLVGERRWGGYPAHALAYGLRSSLSLPLTAGGRTTGALNLYSRTAHAFDAPAVRASAAELAAQGSALLGVVMRHAGQVALTEQLREALTSRSVIDQALGILIGQQRCTGEEAFAILRSASQNRNRKLRDVAAEIVDSASGSRAVDLAAPVG